MNFDLILEAYRKTIVGKEFVYKSKYGSTTFGTVSRVMITYNYEKVQLEPGDYQPIEVEKTWSGVSPRLYIISTNGTPYDLKEDEIYFID